MKALTHEYCENAVREKFGDSVLFIKYMGDKEKSYFSCSKHGEFRTRFRGLMYCKYPCKKCFIEDQPNIARKDNTKYILEVKKRVGDKYDFSKFTPMGMTDKSTLICSKHGEFDIDLHHLYYRDQGCNSCGNEIIGAKNRVSQDYFMKKVLLVQGDRYTYDNLVFNGYNTKVTVTCPKHGDFNTDPSSLIAGSGCPTCSDEHKEKYTSRKRFKVSCAKNSNKGFLYIAKFMDDSESFYKIGISSNVKSRMRQYRQYHTELLHVESGEPESIFNKELMLKRMFKKQSYTPNKKFGGYTECFYNLDKISLYVE